MLRNRGFTRTVGIAVAVCALVVATPQMALAKVDNLWGVWASEVTDRSKVEIPFVILTSLPAMILSTPFWFGVWSVDQIKNLGDDEESEYAASESGAGSAEAEETELEAEAETTGSDEVEAEATGTDGAEAEATGADTAEAEAKADE
jgi:hypothetical protein